ncbi:MAG: dicarboxylate/amino acid:cation symporter, partial [Treponemataceae bacterium]|nr:dicarboxylate/amino acid:cation symporter [Treponemataceae bacterium]
MKVWIKYVIGIVLGIAAALLLPTDVPAVSTAIVTIQEFFVRFGRYTLLPLLLFGVSNAVYKLRSRKMMARTGAWTAAVIVGSSLIVTAVGVLSILLVALSRIPITGEKVTEVAAIDVRSLVMRL